jgi:NAD(P)-dependent dehydrogenase (short-subunit alcohol dehydrogenase family)
MQRIGDSIKGKRVLITQCNEFMGPALKETFEFYGADVYGDSQRLLSQTIVNNMVRNANDPDIVILNLVYPFRFGTHEDLDMLEWNLCFAHMVHPLPRIAKAILPYMLKRKQGKVIVMGSTTSSNGLLGGPAYNAARGAQESWVKRIGLDMAKYNIQINYIAQAFVSNPTFYPNGIDPAELELIPARRLAHQNECTALAVFLSSFESNFFAGQSFPIAGGLV